MSFATLKRAVHQAPFSSVSQRSSYWIQRRYTHRSSSYAYAEIWKRQKIDYVAQMGRPHFQYSPKLINRILSVETAMRVQGLTSFVHAMPAGAKVLTEFSAAIYQNASNPWNRYFKYLRCPDTALPWEKAVKQISAGPEKSQKPHLLSVSYALLSGIRPLESAASWGFVNHFGNEQNLSLLSNLEALLQREDSRVRAYFRDKGWQLIRQYGRLQVGDFLVMGVPESKLSRFVYDSAPYNIPTGRDVRSVAREPHKHLDSLMKEETHMASLIVCKETLDPRSGLVMVIANDEEEVAAFCGNRHFKPMQEVALYQEVLKTKDTGFEEQEREKRKQIDAQLKFLVQEFVAMRRDPQRQLVSSWTPWTEEEESAASDFAPQAF